MVNMMPQIFYLLRALKRSRKGQQGYAREMVLFIVAIVFALIFLAAFKPKILGLSSVIGCGSPWVQAIGSMVQDPTGVTICG